MLHTKRIKLEPLQTEHKEALQKLFCENHIVMQSTLKGRVFTKTEFEACIQKEFVTPHNDKLGFRCLISKTDNQLIGVSGLHPFQYSNKATHEFGFILHQDYWGKGLATEIGDFWLKYAESELNLNEIMATVNPNNVASKRVLEKLGMQAIHEYHSTERGLRLIFAKQL